MRKSITAPVNKKRPCESHDRLIHATSSERFLHALLNLLKYPFYNYISLCAKLPKKCGKLPPNLFPTNLYIIFNFIQRSETKRHISPYSTHILKEITTIATSSLLFSHAIIISWNPIFFNLQLGNNSKSFKAIKLLPPKTLIGRF